jgi:hypothetical protein
MTTVRFIPMGTMLTILDHAEQSASNMAKDAVGAGASSVKLRAMAERLKHMGLEQHHADFIALARMMEKSLTLTADIIIAIQKVKNHEHL